MPRGFRDSEIADAALASAPAAQTATPSVAANVAASVAALPTSDILPGQAAKLRPRKVKAAGAPVGAPTEVAEPPANIVGDAATNLTTAEAAAGFLNRQFATSILAGVADADVRAELLAPTVVASPTDATPDAAGVAATTAATTPEVDEVLPTTVETQGMSESSQHPLQPTVAPNVAAEQGTISSANQITPAGVVKIMPTRTNQPTLDPQALAAQLDELAAEEERSHREAEQYAQAQAAARAEREERRKTILRQQELRAELADIATAKVAAEQELGTAMVAVQAAREQAEQDSALANLITHRAEVATQLAAAQAGLEALKQNPPPLDLAGDRLLLRLTIAEQVVNVPPSAGWGGKPAAASSNPSTVTLAAPPPTPPPPAASAATVAGEETQRSLPQHPTSTPLGHTALALLLCLSCGRAVPAGDFCLNCGHSLNATTATLPPPASLAARSNAPTPLRRVLGRRLLTGAVALTICSVLAIAVYALWLALPQIAPQSHNLSDTAVDNGAATAAGSSLPLTPTPAGNALVPTVVIMVAVTASRTIAMPTPTAAPPLVIGVPVIPAVITTSGEIPDSLGEAGPTQSADASITAADAGKTPEPSTAINPPTSTPTTSGDKQPAATQTPPNAVAASISYPRLGISSPLAPVDKVPLLDNKGHPTYATDGRMYVRWDTNPKYASLHSGSPAGGEAGGIVVNGHNWGHGRGIFSPIAPVQGGNPQALVGDHIFITNRPNADGKAYEYVVDSVRILPPTSTTYLKMVDPTTAGPATLTIITCTAVDGKLRVIVHASLREEN